MARGFNGTSDQAVTGAVASTATSNFAMSCWARLDSSTAGSNRIIFYNGIVGSNGYGLGTDTVNGLLLFAPGISGGSGSFTFTIGAWVHLLVRRDSTNINIYVNGTATITGYTGTPSTPTAQTSIGSAVGSSYFPGTIADAAIWNALLSTTEITSLSKGIRPPQIRPKSLNGYWPLAGLQSPEPDLSGSANNATLTGTQPVFGPPLAPTPTTRNRSFMLFSPTPPRIYGIAGFASAEW